MKNFDRIINIQKKNMCFEVSMKFLDFFSGIGGFRLGMELAGH